MKINFLQPETSFDDHGMHESNQRRELIKQSIHENFDSGSSLYPVEEVSIGKPVALLM
ncbi:hypothetical protein ISP15_04555 [Dyella jejuensis]|uniref:Uncharacterized protein n=1 Tax=Dyella jejuensis TaxID=1432009 RepID=A0ABW8JET2_9GAMM